MSADPPDLIAVYDSVGVDLISPIQRASASPAASASLMGADRVRVDLTTTISTIAAGR